MGKGNNTTTSTTGPAPEAQSAYDALLNRASGVASTPYQAYGGQLVAPINQQQQSGVAGINQYSSWAQPYFQQAGTLLNNASQPINSGQVANYENPWQQQVVGATQGQFDLMNKQALNNIQGNAASSGALGGDRAGVAKDAYYGAVLPGQEQQIAAMESQGYTSALQTAIQQYQQNPASIAYGLGNIGGAGQSAALTGANAQVGAGTLEQQTEQAQLGANYGQFQQAQAFPYQQTQWLAGIDTGVGSQLGGTSTTTPPAPNPLNQVLGLAATAAGAYMGAKRGGRIAGFAGGGPIDIRPSAATRSQYPNPDYGRQIGELRALGVPDHILDQMTSQAWNPSLGGPGISPASHSMVDQAGAAPGTTYGPTSSGDAIYRHGGRIAGFDSGGPVMPWGGAQGWIPGVGIVRGQGAPHPPSVPNQGQGASPQASKAAAGVGAGLANWNQGISTDAAGSGFPMEGSADANSLSAMVPMGGGGFGIGGVKTGGRVQGFADGGTPFDDQWSSLSGLGSVAPIQPDVVPMPAQRPMSAPRPNVGYSGTDMAPVDATDISLNAGSGGLGLGLPYEGTNPAIMADSGVNPGVPRGPIAGVGAGAGAPLAYGPGYDRQAGFASPAPTQASPQGGFLDNLPGRGILSHAAGQGLMAAGLGMMASKSPFLGQAIGEGGLRGLGEYTGEQQREANLAHQQAQESLEGRKVSQGADRLSQEAKHWQDQIALETRKQGFTENQPRVVPMGAELVAPQGPNAGKVIASNTASTLDPASVEILGRRLAGGDASALSGLPQGTPGAAARTAIQNKAAEVLTKEGGMSPTEAASTVTARTQDVHATGVGLGAGARTAATREANLNIILKATEAAIPAAIDASEKLDRTGWVPLNRIIQGGRVIASDPDQKRFGMANLQLAEHWARAMNPTGVMRESDRDMALGFLNTADSKETYRVAVDQLHTQIERERAAVQSVKGGTSGATTPPGGGTQTASLPPEAVSRLKEGTHTKFGNGQTWTLQNGQPVQVP